MNPELIGDCTLAICLTLLVGGLSAPLFAMAIIMVRESWKGR